MLNYQATFATTGQVTFQANGNMAAHAIASKIQKQHGKRQSPVVRIK